MVRTKDRVIAGVCGGLAKDLGMDPVLMRLLFVLAFLLFGIGPIIYLILWVLMPNEA
jgi:phage shock protein C